jgi:hypothetical protein
MSSDMMLRFGNNLLKLQQIVSKMTLEGLGVPEEKITSHLGSLTHTLRLCHYGVQSDTGSGLSMGAHRDFNMSTLVVQHEVEARFSLSEIKIYRTSWIKRISKMESHSSRARHLHLSSWRPTHGTGKGKHAFSESYSVLFIVAAAVCMWCHIRIAGRYQRQGAGVGSPR